MAQLKDFINNFDLSDDPAADPTADAFGEVFQVSNLGRVHVQIEHDFSNANTIVYPLISIDGVNFTPIYKIGVRIEVALVASPTSFIITDLIPGSSVKLGMIYADQDSGSISIKTAG